MWWEKERERRVSLISYQILSNPIKIKDYQQWYSIQFRAGSIDLTIDIVSSKVNSIQFNKTYNPSPTLSTNVLTCTQPLSSTLGWKNDVGKWHVGGFCLS